MKARVSGRRPKGQDRRATRTFKQRKSVSAWPGAKPARAPRVKQPAVLGRTQQRGTPRVGRKRRAARPASTHPASSQKSSMSGGGSGAGAAGSASSCARHESRVRSSARRGRSVPGGGSGACAAGSAASCGRSAPSRRASWPKPQAPAAAEAVSWRGACSFFSTRRDSGGGGRWFGQGARPGRRVGAVVLVCCGVGLRLARASSGPCVGSTGRLWACV